MDLLVRRAQGGDQAAFETLYRQHVGRVYALCLRMTADPARAEELTQDAFVRVWERLSSFRGESEFSSWLHRLTVNVVFAAQRADRRYRARVEAVEELSTVAGHNPQLETGSTVDLEEAIRSLPAGAREVFVLHDVEGYRHAEIAKMTGIAAGTSKAQLHRARRLLQEMLGR